MAEIVRFVAKKQSASPARAEASALPFQLLFFTGVRYERSNTAPFATSASEVRGKTLPRKRVLKA
jgi:hypothetical protein